jgi:hypothetical protein
MFFGGNSTFRRDISPLSSGPKSKTYKKPPEAGGKLILSTLPPVFGGFLFVLLFDPEDEGNMFLRNVGHDVMFT